MPLPPALLARLEKRGLLAGNERKERNEEVIAEDRGDRTRRALLAVKVADPSEKPPITGHPGCPNKCNVFHECSIYCKVFWGPGVLEPDKAYLRLKKKLLTKYPLPDTWKEEYDPGSGRFFYWDQQTNIVSWLPPSHPKAQMSHSAAQLREQISPLLSQQDEDEDEDDEDEDEDDSDDDDDSMDNSVDEEEEKIMQFSELQSRLNRERRRHLQDKQSHRGRPHKKENDLDPMDPAAYSDIPRGTWSTGLGKPDDAKTGVDTTASGPLFQQRPYPSPGSILRANAKPHK